MPNQAVINLEENPPRLVSNIKYTEATIGDLHANIIKLIHILVHVGIIELDHKTYKDLVQIYKNPSLTLSDLIDFQNILDKHIIVLNTNITIRLLGDCLFDRGRNDILFLKFLKFLTFHHVSYRIIFSNHDAEFLRLMINHPKSCPTELTQSNFCSTLSGSVHQLLHSVLEYIVSWEEVQSLYYHYYLPALTLIDYSVTNDNQDFHLYTHAPTTLLHLQEMAKSLNIAIDWVDIQSLMTSLNQLNETFAYLVFTKKIIEFLNYEHELFTFIWRRESDLEKSYVPPSNFAITYVFGHDNKAPSDQLTPLYIPAIRLDNFLGKTLLNNPEHLSFSQTCLLTEYETYPLQRIDFSISRSYPIQQDILWQEWIEKQSTQQPLSSTNHNIEHTTLTQALEFIELHPELSKNCLYRFIFTLQNSESHMDILVIKDILKQITQLQALINKIENHIKQYHQSNHALQVQKKTIESHITDYHSGKINHDMIILQIKISIQNITQLFSHEANWQKIITNTLLTTILSISLFSIAYNTSLPIFLFILALILFAQASQMLSPLAIQSEYDEHTQELKKILR